MNQEIPNFLEILDLAERAEELGFDSVWAVTAFVLVRGSTKKGQKKGISPIINVEIIGAIWNRFALCLRQTCPDNEALAELRLRCTVAEQKLENGHGLTACIAVDSAGAWRPAQGKLENWTYPDLSPFFARYSEAAIRANNAPQI